MKRKHFLLMLLLFAAGTVGFFSCKKQSAVEQSMEISKVEKLALEFTQPIAENYASLKSEYSGLNESELREFWLNIYRINSQKRKQEISEGEFISQFENFDKKSTTDFGKTFNKITDAELVKVFIPERNSAAASKQIDPPPNPDCPYLLYPERFYWGDPNAPYSPPFNSWRLTDYVDGECDGYEVTYNGFWNRLRAITPLGAQSIALFLQGDYVPGPMRTRVLHKKLSVDYWFGGVNGINDNLRMSQAAQ